MKARMGVTEKRILPSAGSRAQAPPLSAGSGTSGQVRPEPPPAWADPARPVEDKADRSLVSVKEVG